MKNEPADWELVKARIQQRHVLDGDCWEWKSYFQRGVPILHYTAKDGRSVAKSVRELAYATTGQIMRENFRYVANCGNPTCVNPEHMRAITYNEHMRRVSIEAKKSNAVRSAKIANTKRVGAKLDIEKVRFIRSSDLTERVLSEMFGVSKAVIGKVRRNETWIEHNSFFRGL